MYTQVDGTSFIDDTEGTQVPFSEMLKDFSCDVSWNFLKKRTGVQEICGYPRQYVLSDHIGCDIQMYDKVPVDDHVIEAEEETVFLDVKHSPIIADTISTTPSAEMVDSSDIHIESEQKTVYQTMTYIGNKNSHVFHVSSCASVKRMKESNQVILENKEDALSQGYRPCKVCQP